MSNLISNGKEIAQRGKERYENLRPQVETPENIGKIIAIDLLTGDYEIGDDLLSISLGLKSRHPSAEMWAERIGFNAVYSIGGTLTRTAL
jgi:hypothetical protein